MRLSNALLLPYRLQLDQKPSQKRDWGWGKIDTNNAFGYGVHRGRTILSLKIDNMFFFNFVPNLKNSFRKSLYLSRSKISQMELLHKRIESKKEGILHRDRLKLLGAALFTSLLVVCPESAMGNDERTAYKQGVEYFEAEQYIQAADAFRQAYAYKPTWKLLYNIAQSEAAAGRYGLALDAFESYLAEGADRVPEERSEEILSEIKRLRVLIGVIDVHAPDGIELTVDDVVRGVTPLSGPVRVAVGKHRCILTKDDASILDKEVKVVGGMSTVLEYKEKEPEPEVVPAPIPLVEPEPTPQKTEEASPKEPEQAGETGPKPQEEPKKKDRKRLSPAVFYSMLGVTGALAVGTVVLEFAVNGQVSKLEDDPSDKGAADKGESLQVGERILLVATGAAVVTTIVLIFFTDFKRKKEKPEDKTTAITVAAPFVTEGGAGFGLVGRF